MRLAARPAAPCPTAPQNFAHQADVWLAYLAEMVGAVNAATEPAGETCNGCGAPLSMHHHACTYCTRPVRGQFYAVTA